MWCTRPASHTTPLHHDHDLNHEHHHQHHLHHVMHEVATTKEVHHKVESLRILEGGVQPCQEPGEWSELISCHPFPSWSVSWSLSLNVIMIFDMRKKRHSKSCEKVDCPVRNLDLSKSFFVLEFALSGILLVSPFSHNCFVVGVTTCTACCQGLKHLFQASWCRCRHSQLSPCKFVSLKSSFSFSFTKKQPRECWH